MIRWRNPKKELPKQDEKIWVLMQHPSKGTGELCCEIVGAEAQHTGDEVTAWNNDDLGLGLQIYTFKDDGGYPDNVAIAWCPFEELPGPEWLDRSEVWWNLEEK